MKKFEYIHITSISYIEDNKLNELGKEGWELVNISITMSNCCMAYFKRELKESDAKFVKE